jgi:hypothetical protein
MMQAKLAGSGTWRDAFPGAWAWFGVSVILFVDLVWIAVDPRLTLNYWSYKYLAVAIGLAALFAVLFPRSLERARDTALGLVFVVIAFAALHILNHLTMTLRFPLADGWLAGLDSSFGLDWRVYADWVARHPFVADIFDWTYGRLAQMTTLGLAVLFLIGRFDRAREFVRMVFWCGAVAIVAGMAFPAKAAVAHFADPNLVAAFGPGAGTYHLPFLDLLRSDEPVRLSIARMPGLVTFPSFHTAGGLLLAYAFRDVRFLGPLVFLYVAVMIASTPIMGGHYLVDLPAGALLAVAVVVIDGALVRRRGGQETVSLPADAASADG